MFIDMVKKNRSCRGYDISRRVTKDELLYMVDCARLSAASVNIQPLKYYLAWEEDEVSRIQPLTKWAKGLPQLELPHPGMEPAAFIVICHDTGIVGRSAVFMRDVGIAAQTMLLAATEMDLGGCMIGSFDAGQVKAELVLPAELDPVLIVAVGKPAEQIVLTEAEPDGSVKYYRDADDVHYVPKRRLKDIVLTSDALE